MLRRTIGNFIRSAKAPFIHHHAVKRGYRVALPLGDTPTASAEQTPNDLRKFFDETKERAVWKWLHYFDIYDRHFRKFRGKEVHLLEIGIYSGGSLEMWREYFGPKAVIYGVDIAENRRELEREGYKIFIGDQGSREFWRDFRKQVPALDVVIDDGSHIAEHQTVSMEELLPILRPGGVYACEDVHRHSEFASFVHGMAHRLNDVTNAVHNYGDIPERAITCDCTPFQEAVNSIHLYPFVAVLERNEVKPPEFVCPMHGKKWLEYT